MVRFCYIWYGCVTHCRVWWGTMCRFELSVSTCGPSDHSLPLFHESLRFISRFSYVRIYRKYWSNYPITVTQFPGNSYFSHLCLDAFCKTSHGFDDMPMCMFCQICPVKGKSWEQRKVERTKVSRVEQLFSQQFQRAKQGGRAAADIQPYWNAKQVLLGWTAMVPGPGYGVQCRVEWSRSRAVHQGRLTELDRGQPWPHQVLPRGQAFKNRMQAHKSHLKLSKSKLFFSFYSKTAKVCIY